MKENSIKNERSSIEEDIKIALDKFSDNKDIDSAILIVEKFILGNYILRGGRKNIVKDSLRYILSDYKKLQEEFNQVDHECDRLEKIDFEKDMKIKELQKENEELEEINNELEAVKDEAIRRYNFETIPIKKVKDKIEEYKNMLKTCNKAQDIDRIKAINERVLELQELLESEE